MWIVGLGGGGVGLDIWARVRRWMLIRGVSEREGEGEGRSVSPRWSGEMVNIDEEDNVGDS